MAKVKETADGGEKAPGAAESGGGPENGKTPESAGDAAFYKALADENFEKYMRVMAEFDNFRKRTAAEKTRMYDDGVSAAVLKMLPVVDSFERALKSESDTETAFYKGVEMVFRQSCDALAGLGVETVKAVGAPFDPNEHFAVAHVEDEALGESEVVEEMQKGYKYKDKIIRCAMVKVAN